MESKVILPITNENGYYEIRLESIGGLGANLCGKMLGELGAIYMKLNSASFSSYGSEKRGSPVKAFIRYSALDNEIGINSPVEKPHILGLFHEAMIGKSAVTAGVDENTQIVINTTASPEEIREKMKLYAGLDERGFSLTQIRQTLQGNQTLLEQLELPRFSYYDLSGMRAALSSVKTRMGEYSVEGLWFSYGEIVVAERTFHNVTGFLAELLTTGILSLVGIPKEEVSDRSLSGKDLPSAGLEEENFLEELMACIEEVQALFKSGGIKEVLLEAGNIMLNGTALELYSMKYFHHYGGASPYTKLCYEREYLIFGKEEDKSNLFSMVLYLVAIRTLLNMVMILKQPDRVVQLEALSAGVAGFTGIPVLAAVVKYSMLLLWSVEEALVDTAALLQGKRIPVTGPGRVSFGELFLMNKSAIKRKADLCPDGIGAAYTDYLALVSLTRRTRDKTYRALDLIQENIRFRYRDSFRIRNLVTGISFQTVTKLKPVFDVGFFPAQVYEMKKDKEVSY